MNPDAPIIFGAPMLPDPARLSALIAEAMATGWLTNGAALHQRLEAALAAHQLPSDAVTLTSSGTMALTLALMLGDLPKGAEVITPPLSFAASAQVIAALGLVPVFADVDPISLTLCPGAVEAAITPRTAAILSVHFLGAFADVHALAALASRHGLWLVHDAAHVFGAKLDGLPIGSFGDASAFSLHATKMLHTAEGGFVTSRVKDASVLAQMRNFGLEQGVPVRLGLNGKLSELNAAMGLALLPDLEQEIAARRALRNVYDAALTGLPGLRPAATGAAASQITSYYALRLSPHLRAGLLQALKDRNIFARDTFPLLCGPKTPWRGSKIWTASGQDAVAPLAAQELICLPFHGRVDQGAATRVTEVITQFMTAAAEGPK